MYDPAATLTDLLPGLPQRPAWPSGRGPQNDSSMGGNKKAYALPVRVSTMFAERRPGSSLSDQTIFRAKGISSSGEAMPPSYDSRGSTLYTGAILRTFVSGFALAVLIAGVVLHRDELHQRVMLAMGSSTHNIDYPKLDAELKREESKLRMELASIDHHGSGSMLTQQASNQQSLAASASILKDTDEAKQEDSVTGTADAPNNQVADGLSAQLIDSHRELMSRFHFAHLTCCDFRNRIASSCFSPCSAEARRTPETAAQICQGCCSVGCVGAKDPDSARASSVGIA
jgi:hypothetical protein